MAYGALSGLTSLPDPKDHLRPQVRLGRPFPVAAVVVAGPGQGYELAQALVPQRLGEVGCEVPEACRVPELGRMR